MNFTDVSMALRPAEPLNTRGEAEDLAAEMRRCYILRPRWISVFAGDDDAPFFLMLDNPLKPDDFLFIRERGDWERLHVRLHVLEVRP